MKSLISFINEKLHVSNYKEKGFEYQPKNKSELMQIIRNIIQKEGNECNLNSIDLSNIEDISFLFFGKDLKQFDGDISKWDVSHIKNMEGLFYYSEFNGDISDWDVSNCDNLACMFEKSKFCGNINNWKIKDTADLEGIFHACPLENHPPKWYKQ